MNKYRRVFYEYDFDPDRPGVEEFVDIFCTAVIDIYSHEKFHYYLNNGEDEQ